ncbi:MAG: lipocalin-like domain-containing protein, partial [Saprospiraceae bacterium]|nr:lipocalin-like domain-containing protein [Saprospiraceae bacterium]
AMWLSCIAFQLKAQSYPPNLIGEWALVDWTATSSIGEVLNPFGDDPLGRVFYTGEGSVVLVLMRSDRPLFASDDPSERTLDEIEMAFHSFFTYTGRFEVNANEAFIEHEVELCSNPNWVGRTQTRYYELIGNTLVLTTPPIETTNTADEAVKHKLVWTKVH